VSNRARVAFAALWIASLLGVARLSTAQAPERAPSLPRILTGADLGFRLERYDRGTPVGRLMVRVDGRWVEADFSMNMQRLTTP
jgi:hypothetical protein